MNRWLISVVGFIGPFASMLCLASCGGKDCDPSICRPTIDVSYAVPVNGSYALELKLGDRTLSAACPGHTELPQFSSVNCTNQGFVFAAPSAASDVVEGVVLKQTVAEKSGQIQEGAPLSSEDNCGTACARRRGSFDNR